MKNRKLSTYEFSIWVKRLKTTVAKLRISESTMRVSVKKTFELVTKKLPVAFILDFVCQKFKRNIFAFFLSALVEIGTNRVKKKKTFEQIE